ncbi:GNAT family N-acetyltransferase [Paenibacillus sp. PK3_47]|uniref:GNAT family N-acetyltransferase n=1 Tax=Paenibacillus sp. PK3_47 TaxID=2072642 RepID=UPI00201DD994|nr:GNAT family N-acetyltransferase [Paenibacillus sp. PK3_47]UQZ36182.1 GNAT family N-acetyltransferase [Paenibacillus sp. PK3_47]
MNTSTVIITEEPQLQAAKEIRQEVFVKEQGVPLEEEFDAFDTLDAGCTHILVYHNGQAAGTGRIREVEGLGKLERICLLPAFRKYGLGRVIIQSLEEIAADKGISKVKLHGQTQAEGFYHKLGYTTSSEMFMEDGIPHVLMTRTLINE